MKGMVRLIVTADDFGLSPSVNAGILEAHECGIVSSTSLMVRWPDADDAARLAHDHPRLAVGLHVDLGEWAYIGGQWVAVYEVTPPDDAYAIRMEVEQQVQRFRELTGGRHPTHLDSHQHVHQREPVRSILRDAASLLGVPLRHFSPQVRYCGRFYGQTTEGKPLPEAIGVDALCALLEELDDGITELCCHPGATARGEALETMYKAERAIELQTLCDPRVRATIEARGIQLISFHDLEPVATR